MSTYLTIINARRARGGYVPIPTTSLLHSLLHAYSAEAASLIHFLLSIMLYPRANHTHHPALVLCSGDGPNPGHDGTAVYYIRFSVNTVGGMNDVLSSLRKSSPSNEFKYVQLEEGIRGLDEDEEVVESYGGYSTGTSTVPRMLLPRYMRLNTPFPQLTHAYSYFSAVQELLALSARTMTSTTRSARLAGSSTASARRPEIPVSD